MRVYRDAWGVCMFIGAVGVYAYFLAFMYTVCMSWVIIQSLRNQVYKENMKNWEWRMHLLPHAVSLVLVIPVLAGSGMGNSIMETCFVQSQSWAEYSPHRVLLLLPLIVFIPWVIGAVSYALLKYKTEYKKFIIRHLAAVIVFSMAWFPVALLHFWNADFINGNPPKVLKQATSI